MKNKTKLKKCIKKVFNDNFQLFQTVGFSHNFIVLISDYALKKYSLNIIENAALQFDFQNALAEFKNEV